MMQENVAHAGGFHALVTSARVSARKKKNWYLRMMCRVRDIRRKEKNDGI